MTFYNLRNETTSEEALSNAICGCPNLRDARVQMPGLPVWPWVQAFSGYGYRWPTPGEHTAASNLSLAEGVRGAFYFAYKPPVAGQFEALADANMQPTQRLFDLKTFLPTFAKMGQELVGYEVSDKLAATVTGKALASVYVSKTDPQKMYLMLASREAEGPQLVRLTFPTAGQVVVELKDFVDGSSLPVRMEPPNAVADVELKAASGRLLAIVPQGSAAATTAPPAAATAPTASPAPAKPAAVPGPAAAGPDTVATPSLVTVDSPREARIAEGTRLCDLADKLLAEGKRAEALKLYQEVLKFLPTSPRARAGCTKAKTAVAPAAGGVRQT